MKYDENILGETDMQIVNCKANSFKFLLFLHVVRAFRGEQAVACKDNNPQEDAR